MPAPPIYRRCANKLCAYGTLVCLLTTLRALSWQCLRLLVQRHPTCDQHNTCHLHQRRDLPQHNDADHSSRSGSKESKSANVARGNRAIAN